MDTHEDQRHLDRQCAEAMGWHADGGHWLTAEGADTTWRDYPDWHRWQPSTDIAAAWTLIEWCYSGSVSRLSNGAEYEAYLVIELNDANADGYARAATPALAIVQAFLELHAKQQDG